MSLALSQCPVKLLASTCYYRNTRYGSCRLAILDENDCPGVKKCGQHAASTPQRFYMVVVSTLHALREVAHLLQTCPRCCLLHVGSNAIEPEIIPYTVAHWDDNLRECCPWSKIQACCYVDWSNIQTWHPRISFAGGHMICFKHLVHPFSCVLFLLCFVRTLWESTAWQGRRPLLL